MLKCVTIDRAKAGSLAEEGAASATSTAFTFIKERQSIGNPKIRSLEEIKREFKRLVVENLSLEDLKPDDIQDDMKLFGGEGIGLDSLDGVEMVVLLRETYGLDVKAMQKGRDIFRSINTLAPYVLANATK